MGNSGIKRKKLKGRHKKAQEQFMEEQWGFYNHHGLSNDQMYNDDIDDTDPDKVVVPISTKLRMTREKKEELQQDYQNQLLLYNILLLNAYYKSIPSFISQKQNIEL